jgi:hypothetical protein
MYSTVIHAADLVAPLLVTIITPARAGRRGSPQMFCLPPNLALTGDQVEDILQRAAKKVRKVPDDMPGSIILLDGLKDTFPCTKC